MYLFCRVCVISYIHKLTNFRWIYFFKFPEIRTAWPKISETYSQQYCKQKQKTYIGPLGICINCLNKQQSANRNSAACLDLTRNPILCREKELAFPQRLFSSLVCLSRLSIMIDCFSIN